jgi:hypothetical protein
LIIPRVEVPLIVAAAWAAMYAAGPRTAPFVLIAQRAVVQPRLEVAKVAGVANPDAMRVLRVGIRLRAGEGRGAILDRVTVRMSGPAAGYAATPVLCIRATRVPAHIGLAGHKSSDQLVALGSEGEANALVRVAIELLAATSLLRPLCLPRIVRRRPKAGAGVRRRPNTRPATWRGKCARDGAKKGSGFRRHFRGRVLRRVVRLKTGFAPAEFPSTASLQYSVRESNRPIMCALTVG